MKLPKHHILTISHNDHKAGYETIGEYLECFDHLKESIFPEDLKICVERDELWIMQWYPYSPISFHVIVSYSLDKCLEIYNQNINNYY